ncbi:hypothetical protein LZ318_12535 [Saccharopolyspora indica]|uniref:hypothetical protein n=1 Tax=Saccharopolyspora indica TaxID=1229659 RepID=UPI0022EA1F34|nr:hypothetical protein [Saccharopolyspora indica]MDA3643662.1 hypothetical protein [Saccharopolyspora indica]
MLGYRSVFQVEQGSVDILARVREQLHSWLRRKQYDGDALKPGSLVSLGPNADGVMLETEGKDGSSALRVRVTEKQPGGIWTSQLTVHVPGSGDPAMVWVDIINPEVISEDGDQPQRRQWTATPRLVRDLLMVLPATDGKARLDSRPERVRGEEAEELVGIIRDPGRRGPVYLVGSEESLPQEPWFRLASKVLHETVGIGAGYLLNPEATRTFARAVGKSHEVRPGTMRTFLPGAEPGDTTDALRHRVLSTGRIVKDEQRRLTRLLGWRARDVAIEQRLPKTAVRLDRQFEEQLDELLVGGAAAAPAAPRITEVTPAILGRDVEIVQVLREELGESELTVDRLREVVAFARVGQGEQAKRQALSERFAELQKRNAELQESLDEVSKQLDDETLELAEANTELNKEKATTRHLRGLLGAERRYEDAWSEPTQAEYELPDSFLDVLPMIKDLKHVEFTGDDEPTFKLEERDRAGVWASKTWEALVALEDYARASAEGRCDRDVHGYLLHLPDGCRGFSANKHARDETDDVRSNTKLSRVRTFQVPPEFVAEREIFMGAHFKIANSGMISPRMHYYDATNITGKIYVGYIGVHLPSRMTN